MSPAPPAARRRALLGVEFDDISLAETVRQLLARPPSARFAYVVTPNADHIVRLWRILALRPVYQRAMFCLLDSKFISLCAGRLGMAYPPVVTGADLTAALLPMLRGQRVAVIGMAPAAFKMLAARYPDVEFLHHAPPMGLLHYFPAFAAARDFACASRAAFIFIALGSPVQEVLAHAIALRRESTGTGLCIGAGLAFCAGSAPRAPGWMRARGLEFLFRLALEPRRLAGRYLLDCPWVLAGLLSAAWVQKRR